LLITVRVPSATTTLYSIYPFKSTTTAQVHSGKLGGILPTVNNYCT